MRALRNAAATVALSLALGGLVIGAGVAIPGVADGDLVDANLRRALTDPVELRILSSVSAAAGVATLAMIGRGEGRFPTTCVLLALIMLLALRLWLLPETLSAAALVDLEARLPAHRLDNALAWRQRTTVCETVVGFLLAAALIARDTIAMRSLRAFAHPHTRASAAVTTAAAGDDPSS